MSRRDPRTTARRAGPLRLALTSIVALAIGAFPSAACSDDDGEASKGLTVFAAASLTDAFTRIAGAFEETEAGVSIALNFEGSQALRTQLEQGAEADLFAPANTEQMEMALDSGLVGEFAAIFARNRLIVITPAANPANIETLQDLASPGVKLVLANEDVPVGAYSRQFLENTSADPAFGEEFKDRVLANVVSEESNVRQVASKVQLGEADAAIVYASDVTDGLADDIATVEIPDRLNVVAEYPIAVTSDPPNADSAAAFIAFVLSEEGQAILADSGFLGAPP